MAVSEFKYDNYFIDGVYYASLSDGQNYWRLGTSKSSWPIDLNNIGFKGSLDVSKLAAEQGIWLDRDQVAAPLAVVCGGMGAAWPHMGRDLYDNFPVCRRAMDQLSSIADWDLLSLMDENDPEIINQTRLQIPYLFLLEYAQWSQFVSLGIKPALMSGHSLGELIALCFAGVYTPETAWHLLDTRAEHIAGLEKRTNKQGGMLAITGNLEEAFKILPKFPAVHLANRNTERQIILSGPREDLLIIRRTLRKQHIPAIMLNMSLAFHNPHMKILRDLSVRRLIALDMTSPKIPMLSCVTAGLYPDSREAICGYIADLDENTVNWQECVRTMVHDYGIRHWLELGPQEIICGLVQDNYEKAIAFPASRKDREAESLREACARLYSHGHLDSAQLAIRGRSHFFKSNRILVAGDRKKTNFSDKFLKREFSDQEIPIVKIIADICGKREEDLNPDMDLRTDLAIRSSRFPFLIQQIEKTLGKQVELEKLFGIATIKDIIRIFLSEKSVLSDNRKVIHIIHPKHLYRQKGLQIYHLEKGGLVPVTLQVNKSNKFIRKECKIVAAIFDLEILPKFCLFLESFNIKVILPSFMENYRNHEREIFDSVTYIKCDWPVSPDSCRAFLELVNQSHPDINGLIYMPPAFEKTFENRDEWRKIWRMIADFINNREISAWKCNLQRYEGLRESKDAINEMQERIKDLCSGHEPDISIIWEDANPGDAGTYMGAGLLLSRMLWAGLTGRFIWKSSSIGDLCQTVYVKESPESHLLPKLLLDLKDWRVTKAAGQFSSFEKQFNILSEGSLQLAGSTGLHNNFPNISWGEVLLSACCAALHGCPWLISTGLSDLEFQGEVELKRGLTRELNYELFMQTWMLQEDIPTLPIRVETSCRDISENGRALDRHFPVLSGSILLTTRQMELVSIFDFSSLSVTRFILQSSLSEGKFKNRAIDLAEIHYSTQTQNGGPCVPGWVVKAGWDGFIADEGNWRYKYFSHLINMTLKAAEIIINARRKESDFLNDGTKWKLCRIGYIRYNLSNAAIDKQLKIWLKITWESRTLVRFDCQAENGEGQILAIFYSVEFESEI